MDKPKGQESSNKTIVGVVVGVAITLLILWIVKGKKSVKEIKGSLPIVRLPFFSSRGRGLSMTSRTAARCKYKPNQMLLHIQVDDLIDERMRDLQLDPNELQRLEGKAYNFNQSLYETVYNEAINQLEMEGVIVESNTCEIPLSVDVTDAEVVVEGDEEEEPEIEVEDEDAAIEVEN